MLHITITTKKRHYRKMKDLLDCAEKMAYHDAIRDMVDTLKQKDKICLERTTLVGPHQTVKSCVFFGVDSGVTIESYDEYNKYKNRK